MEKKKVWHEQGFTRGQTYINHYNYYDTWELTRTVSIGGMDTQNQQHWKAVDYRAVPHHFLIIYEQKKTPPDPA